MPPPRQALYFGGLAALAAFEIIEWPVALAIGAGTALMRRSEPRPSQPQTRTKSTTATKETAIPSKSTHSAKAGASSSGRPTGIPPSS
jgi:hypothetical protein